MHFYKTLAVGKTKRTVPIKILADAFTEAFITIHSFSNRNSGTELEPHGDLSVTIFKLVDKKGDFS